MMPEFQPPLSDDEKTRLALDKAIQAVRHQTKVIKQQRKDIDDLVSVVRRLKKTNASLTRSCLTLFAILMILSTLVSLLAMSR